MGYYITPTAVIAVSVILPMLAAIAVASRFLVRSRQAARYGIDDWLILASLVFTAACGISLVVGAALKGLAQPTPPGDGPMGFLTAKNDALVITEKVDWVDMLLQCFSFGLTKMSVVFFYRRIFCNAANQGEAFDTISKITISFVFIWMITFFFVILFECRGHFWAQWDTLAALITYCLDDTKIQLVFSYMDVITDIWILSLPLYPVWKLRLPPRQKLALCAVFLMGALAIAAGVVRLAFYIQLLTSSFKNPDGIRVITTQLYWSLIEMSLCIVAACLPTLKPLFKNIPMESFFSSLRNLFTNISVNSSHFELSGYNSTNQPADGKSQGSQKSLV